MIARLKSYLLILIPLVALTSCDANLFMKYVVINKSPENIQLFIPGFPTDSIPRFFGKRKDTTLTLKPNEELIVGLDQKVDFPWATKNIYRKKPGICGIKKIGSDTIMTLNCSKKEWKYRKRRSVLVLE